ncbi:MAG TPA: class I SAM-dependent methyltransferase [Thermoanaerobaculia bacterium]|jgi:2-polyprenyl-3-methyl-5-hydroxy-6-metoxy-1,4-benzoquinol methylase
MPALSLLFPRYDHPAIEERYASWQSQMLLRNGIGDGEIVFYDRDESAADAAADVDTEFVLVVTDPLLLPPQHLGTRLHELLVSTGAAAVLPITNESDHPQQKRMPPSLYLTLRELQAVTGELAKQPVSIERLTWDKSDPAVFLCRTELLDTIREPLARALTGREVAISATDYVHRWSSLRGQTRYDLLTRVSPNAKAILEFGCGEAPLGEALKRRQPCRVVGIELDPAAAAIAEKRIDAVYRGDVREIVAILDEKFDWIIGGDIVEHLDEPWSFLAELRRVATPGGHLLLSLPNLSNAAIVNDLLHGRFDYVYMGLTCVGHLRFFTKQSLSEMLTIAGWTVVEISPQDFGPTPAREELLSRLTAAGVPFSKEDLLPSGYYVIAKNA